MTNTQTMSPFININERNMPETITWVNFNEYLNFKEFGKNTQYEYNYLLSWHLLTNWFIDVEQRILHFTMPVNQIKSRLCVFLSWLKLTLFTSDVCLCYNCLNMKQLNIFDSNKCQSFMLTEFYLLFEKHRKIFKFTLNF